MLTFIYNLVLLLIKTIDYSNSINSIIVLLEKVKIFKDNNY